MITALIFIVVLGTIILVHEFGHFILARLFKVHVEEFGIGFPPRAIGKKIKNTLYSINWIPLGGFVKLKGEQGENLKDEDSFAHKKPWKRSIILSAGVGMNIILAMALLSIGFMIGLPQAVESDLGRYAQIENQHIQITQVQTDSPADQAGLKPGDIISSIEGAVPTTSEEIRIITSTHNNEQINLNIERNGESQVVLVTPQVLENNNDTPAIGIGTVATADVSYPFFVSIWMGVKEAVVFLGLIISALWTMVVNLLTQQPVSGDLVGPVGVALITGKFVKLGFVYVLQFAALISLNLAIINILPIPALDGGRLFFLLIEKIKGKPVNQRTEAIIHNVGFVVLLLLIGFITIRDFFQIDKINNLF